MRAVCRFLQKMGASRGGGALLLAAESTNNNHNKASASRRPRCLGSSAVVLLYGRVSAKMGNVMSYDAGPSGSGGCTRCVRFFVTADRGNALFDSPHTRGTPRGPVAATDPHSNLTQMRALCAASSR